MLGYNKNLFILAFDHRSTLLRDVFNISNRQPTPEEINKIIEAKKIIYEAYKLALKNGLPQDQSGILVDEEYSDAILRDAKAQKILTCLKIEKSGQAEFDFQYGEDFAQHIEKYQPDFAKVVFEYNPQGNLIANKRSEDNLKILNDYCKETSRKLLVELLIPPTEMQLISVDSDLEKYHDELRYKLAIESIDRLHNKGIEPDIWKLEGYNDSFAYEQIIEKIRSGNREEVGLIILGRGHDKKQVEKWLFNGKGINGVLGFAVGRTIFVAPLKDFYAKKINSTEAVSQISKNYLELYRFFKE
jgi:5-dehydro-2-deoxygluconokinase